MKNHPLFSGLKSRRFKGYKRFGLYTHEEILPLIGAGHSVELPCPMLDCSVWVKKMCSARMNFLKDHHECVCCGLLGRYWWLECSGHYAPHLNLYGISDMGNEVMLTIDHIFPKSKGGVLEPSNMQVLCGRCNAAKADKELTLEELRAVVYPNRPPQAKPRRFRPVAHMLRPDVPFCGPKLAIFSDASRLQGESQAL